MNDDQFLKKKPVKPPAQFTQNLLDQLHELDEQEHEMTVYTSRHNNPTHHRYNQAGMILGLVASLTILFFGVSWLNSNNNYATPTSEPLQVILPRPELIQQLGDYGNFITAAFDEANNSATVLSSLGLFRLSLDDFSADPERIRNFDPTIGYQPHSAVTPLSQGNVMIAVRYDGTIEAINIQTGDTISTWHYEDAGSHVIIPPEYRYTYYRHQLTNDGTRYHASVCVNQSDGCRTQTIATWDTQTGDLLNSVPIQHPFTYTEDGEALFYISRNRIVRQDIAAGEITPILSAEDVIQLAISPDQTKLAFVSYLKGEYSKIFVYDLADTSEPIFETSHTLTGEQLPPVTMIQFSADGQSLVTLGTSNYRVDLTENKVVHLNIDRYSPSYSNIFNADHTLTMRFGSDGILDLRETQDRLRTSITQSDHFNAERYIIPLTAFENGVGWVMNNKNWRWMWEAGQLVSASTGLFRNQTIGSTLAYSPDGRSIAYILPTMDNNLLIYDVEGDEIIRRFIGGRESDITTGTFFPIDLRFDGQNHVLALYPDGIIHTHHIEDGTTTTIDLQNLRLNNAYILASDLSAIAYLDSPDMTTSLSWHIAFLDDANIIGTLVILNNTFAPSPLPETASTTVTFDAQTQSVLFTNSCIPERLCQEVYDRLGDSTGDTLIYHLPLAEIRQQLLEMADLPLEERVIEYTLENEITNSFKQVRQVEYRPNSDQIGARTDDSIIIFRINGSQVEPLYTLPAPHSLSRPSFTFSPDGAMIYIAHDGYLQVWYLPEAE